MIPKETVELIFETARIEEVIGEFVQLKRSGSSLKGLSPFNNERTPSFYVSPAKQIFKDFSSGKGGTVVTFLMEHESFTYPEALRYLAKKYNIEIQEEEQSVEQIQAASEKESLYLVSQFAQKWFVNELENTEEGQHIGLAYFKERGISLASIERFGLGYSPNGRNNFSAHALKSGYQADNLVKSGLSIERTGGELVDRFWGRVMFPIYSMSGRVLGFGARILRSDIKAAKYLNSPETPIYHKSRVLYGLFQAKQAILKKDRCYLVEGYTDVISFSQVGVQNVVSASGTALSKEQISMIKRLTPNLTMLFDGDAAGIRAALRGIDMVLEQEMNLRVVPLPQGEDPDSFARKLGAEDLEAYLKENELDFISFKTKLLLEEAGNDPIKKAALIKDIVGSIAKIPDNIQRELYARQCAVQMDLDERLVFGELSRLREKHLKEQPTQTQTDTQQQPMEVVQSPSIAANPNAATNWKHQVQEEVILRMMMSRANLVIPFDFYDATGQVFETDEVAVGLYIATFFLEEDELMAFENPLYRKIFEESVSIFQETDTFPEEHYWTRHEDSEVASLAADFSTEKYVAADWAKRDVVIPDREKLIKRHVTETLLRLKRNRLDNKIVLLRDALRDFSHAEEARAKVALISQLIAMKNALDGLLKRIV